MQDLGQISRILHGLGCTVICAGLYSALSHTGMQWSFVNIFTDMHSTEGVQWSLLTCMLAWG